VEQGGVHGRVEATGRGVFFGLREVCSIPEDMRELGLAPGREDKRVVVQGLGNVGSHAARFLTEDGGAVLVGAVEFEGAISKPDGIVAADLLEHRAETGSILDFPGATNLGDRDLGLELECDILVPAALENAITMDNAPRLRTRIIAEAANGPVSAEAGRWLTEHGVLVVPDAYINAGGVTVSYFEWLKNLSHIRFGRMEKRFEERSARQLLEAVQLASGRTFSEAEMARFAHGPDELDLVNSGLEETMVQAYHGIRETRMRLGASCDLRIASMVVAIDKVAGAYESRGIFP
jgi:glutamate dehydrogenase (NAD(P)+)